MNGRELFGLYRDSHGEERGQRPGSYDDLSPSDRLVWVCLADKVSELVIEDLRERGIMWEPTS